MKPSIDQSANIPVPGAAKGNTAFQRGLSLIELMISITLGLIILASLSTLFVNQSRTRVELDKSSRMIDNGRYAMELLSNDLRLAGYLGEHVPLLSTCSNAPVGIGGYNAGISAKPSPPAGLTAAQLSVGSDILVIRRASTGTPTVQTAAVDGVQYLQVSLCQYDTRSIIVSTTKAAFTLRQKTCTQAGTTPYADVRRLLEHVYFISPYNTAGDGIPTLKRLETGNPDPVPLVEGIEYMQIEYGIDGNSSFTLQATTIAGSLDLTELSADPFTEKIQPGMGVYNATKIPAGHTVGSVTAANPPLTAVGNHLLPTSPATVTDGKITTIKATGSGAIVAGTSVPLTIPYLTGTIASGVPEVTLLSTDPTLATAIDKTRAARAGYEICASGVPGGTTIASLTPTTITLTNNATADGVVTLNIPAIAISPIMVAGDGVADSYTATPTDAEWANVVSVKLTLVARNAEPTKGYTDTKTYALGKDQMGNVQTVGPFNNNYKRHAYTQFIRMVNTAGRRELP